jgi:hypothetical protein
VKPSTSFPNDSIYANKLTKPRTRSPFLCDRPLFWRQHSAHVVHLLRGLKGIRRRSFRVRQTGRRALLCIYRYWRATKRFSRARGNFFFPPCRAPQVWASDGPSTARAYATTCRATLGSAMATLYSAPLICTQTNPTCVGRPQHLYEHPPGCRERQFVLLCPTLLRESLPEQYFSPLCPLLFLCLYLL